VVDLSLKPSCLSVFINRRQQQLMDFSYKGNEFLEIIEESI
jgi:hypothetical protein